MIRLALAVLACLLPGIPASAQNEAPPRGITIIVPFAAGGVTDMLARVVAERLTQRLGVTVVAENRTGAGGLIAAQAVARARPDGSTLLMHSSAIMVVAANTPDLRFDPVNELVPVGFVAGLPAVLVVHPGVPARSMPELLAYLRANPGRVNCGILGEGGTDHQACRAVERTAGTTMEFPVYRGLPPLNIDLLAGLIQMNFGAASIQMPLVREGRLRALAVGTAQRLPHLPDLPTLLESGVPYDGLAANALFAPAGTPEPLLARLNAEIAAIMAEPAMRERIAGIGALPGPPEAAALGAMFRRDWDRARAAAQR
jgi:tripartite-type tricarboxylate transporter receptor subunit TctC